MKRNSLQFRFSYFNVIFTILIVALLGVVSYILMSKVMTNEVGNRALSLAQTTASRGEVIAAFQSDDPTQLLQPIASQIEEQTGAAYVVIGDHNGVRYTHPIEARVGEKMVGDDNEKALIHGESYISQATGTLGEAIRGKAPILDEGGNIVGIISVGFLKTKIFSTFFSYAKYIVFWTAIAIVIGILGTSQFVREVKKELLNYEPQEIAKILTEQSALIESVREGIIMVNDDGIVTLTNQAANDSIFGGRNITGKNIKDVIPNTQLLEVMKSAQQQFDRPMYINGVKTIVNRTPIFDGERVVGAVSSFRLQSEIDILADELSQVTQYIESLRAQTHEYNNFLYTISGLVQIGNYDEALQLIHHEHQGNQTLIHFMSQRIQDAYLNGIIIGFYNRAKELNVDLQLDESSYCGSLSDEIEKHVFISILGNLVTNAFEAVEHLPEDARIVRLYIFEHETELVFEVEDSGSGLTAEDIKFIFKKKQSTKDQQHRGYGLHIVQQNLLKLNGLITVETGDLGGALFIVSIPMGGVTCEGSH